VTLAWLSGSSDPATSALAPEERRLLESLAAGRRMVGTNFPWPPEVKPFRPTRLVFASVRNGVQFWRVRLSPRYRRFVVQRVRWLLDECEHPLTIITGSQGLELLRRAWPALGSDAGDVEVIALGPVAGRLPDGLRPFVVQASADWISRLGWRGPVDLAVSGGHLDYVRNPEVLEQLHGRVAER
jgi:hypothetical protein